MTHSYEVVKSTMTVRLLLVKREDVTMKEHVSCRVSSRRKTILSPMTPERERDDNGHPRRGEECQCTPL